jgi:hypothetical protein
LWYNTIIETNKGIEMEKQDFRVNYILPKDLVQKDFLVVDFFDSALNQLEWFRQNTLAREKPFPHDDVYLKAITYTEDELKYAKENALVEDLEDGVQFSFPIRNTRTDFEQKNEEGRRMWLRQHLDDHFLHYAIPAMLENSFDWRDNKDPVACKRFENHKEAFDSSLDGAYNLKTKTFWIDGE